MGAGRVCALAHWQGIDLGPQLHIYRCVGACVGLYVLRLHVCLCPCTNTVNKQQKSAGARAHWVGSAYPIIRLN